jgi:uroporphyrinogen III methyltransferase/synthase
MGGAALEEISRCLIRVGFSPDTPAAVIAGGTSPGQRVFRTALAGLGKVELQKNGGPLFPGKPPVLAVIGRVCSLGHKIPVDRLSPEQAVEPSADLRGLRIVVTRPEPKNAETCDKIRALGGVPIPFPCIRIRPLSGWASFRRESLGSSQWLVFTGASGVSCFFEGFLGSGGDLRFFADRKFAVIGPATAEALAGRGFVPDCMPPVFNGTELGLALTEQMRPGEEALLIRSRINERGLDKILKEKAVPFRELAVYETLPARTGSIALSVIKEGRFDFAFFASPSAVSAFAAVCPGSGVKALCIGASTAARAGDFGMETHTAAEASSEGLCRLAAETASRQKRP